MLNQQLNFIQISKLFNVYLHFQRKLFGLFQYKCFDINHFNYSLVLLYILLLMCAKNDNETIISCIPTCYFKKCYSSYICKL